MELQIKKVEDYFEWLQVSAEGYTSTQNISFLVDQLGELTGVLAFTNLQMALAKRIYNQKKAAEYSKMAVSSQAQEKYYAPSLAKDFIAAKCEKEAYDYDVTERLSRTITHTISSLITAISALKSELQFTKYSNA